MRGISFIRRPILSALILLVALWIFLSDRCLIASSGAAVGGAIGFFLALQVAGLLFVAMFAAGLLTDFILSLPSKRLRASLLAVPVYVLLSPWGLWLVLDGERTPADPPDRNAELAWIDAAACCLNPFSSTGSAKR